MIGNTPRNHVDKRPTHTKKVTALPKGKIQRKQETNRWVLHRKTSLGEPLPTVDRNQQDD